MRILKFLTAFIILIGLTLRTEAVSQSERINWFYKSNPDSRPTILGGQLSASDLKNTLYLGNSDDKTIYLTFDAGYSNENLEKTLSVLEKHNIKAAFFILPGIIKNSKETVRKMIDGGHLICNHSTSHSDMSKIGDIETFERELKGIEALYREEFSKEMEKYFRPPEGAFSLKTLEFCETLGYTPVFWSFAYADWDNSNQPNEDYAKEKILSNLHNGMVILLHPTSKTNADILDSVITEIKAKGYSFGTLDELKEKVTNSN